MKLKTILFSTALLVTILEVVQAAPLNVAGSLGFDENTSTGYKTGEIAGVNNSGMAIGWQLKFVNGTSIGFSALRWNGSGIPGVELDNLGTDSTGYSRVFNNAINDSGDAVGYASKYAGTTYKGDRGVLWLATGTAASELGDLGTGSNGVTDGYTASNANAINDVGLIVGYANKYVGGINKGPRAVRWNTTDTTANALDTLGTDPAGYGYSHAYAVNHTSTTVGFAHEYNDAGTHLGISAVRWNGGGTAVTKLDNLGLDSNGYFEAFAFAINNAGTAAGYSKKYSDSTDLGPRAVRWAASGTTAEELAILGTDVHGASYSYSYAINDVGTVVGSAEKYDHAGVSQGQRAVRWDASGTAVTELANLGTDGSGVTSAIAYSLNGAGTTVGYTKKYVGGVYDSDRAVVWLPDASVIDLNDLGVVPVSGGGTWTLNSAKAISSDGWVAGKGTFDPDGAGPLSSYERLWVAQVGLGGKWTNTAGGTWGRGPNWSTGTPAMQVGNAVFDLDAHYAVGLDRNELTKSIAIKAGTVTIDFNGHTLSTENGLTIDAGATLKGSGLILSDIVNAGKIAPGTSPGTLDIDGNLTSTGHLEMEIAGISNYDKINVTGVFDAGGTIAIKLLDGYVPTRGDTFKLLSFGSMLDDGFSFDFSQAVLPAGLRWEVIHFTSNGSVNVVPEPGTLALLLSSLFAGLIFLKFRKS